MADGILGQTPNNIKQILECISGTETNTINLTSKFLSGKFAGTTYTSEPTSDLKIHKTGDYIEVQITVGEKVLPTTSEIVLNTSREETKNLMLFGISGYSSGNTCVSYKEIVKVNGVQVRNAAVNYSYSNATIHPIPAGIKAGDIITYRLECTSGLTSNYNAMPFITGRTKSYSQNQNLSWEYLVSLMF